MAEADVGDREADEARALELATKRAARMTDLAPEAATGGCSGSSLGGATRPRWPGSRPGGPGGGACEAPPEESP